MNKKRKNNQLKILNFVNKSENFKKKQIFFLKNFAVIENSRTFAPASLKFRRPLGSTHYI